MAALLVLRMRRIPPRVVPGIAVEAHIMKL
jgi:hypothetical protein